MKDEEIKTIVDAVVDELIKELSGADDKLLKVRDIFQKAFDACQSVRDKQRLYKKLRCEFAHDYLPKYQAELFGILISAGLAIYHLHQILKKFDQKDFSLQNLFRQMFSYTSFRFREGMIQSDSIAIKANLLDVYDSLISNLKEFAPEFLPLALMKANLVNYPSWIDWFFIGLSRIISKALNLFAIVVWFGSAIILISLSHISDFLMNFASGGGYSKYVDRYQEKELLNVFFHDKKFYALLFREPSYLALSDEELIKALFNKRNILLPDLYLKCEATDTIADFEADLINHYKEYRISTPFYFVFLSWWHTVSYPFLKQGSQNEIIHSRFWMLAWPFQILLATALIPFVMVAHPLARLLEFVFHFGIPVAWLLTETFLLICLNLPLFVKDIPYGLSKINKNKAWLAWLPFKGLKVLYQFFRQNFLSLLIPLIFAAVTIGVGMSFVVTTAWLDILILASIGFFVSNVFAEAFQPKENWIRATVGIVTLLAVGSVAIPSIVMGVPLLSFAITQVFPLITIYSMFLIASALLFAAVLLPLVIAKLISSAIRENEDVKAQAEDAKGLMPVPSSITETTKAYWVLYTKEDHPIPVAAVRKDHDKQNQDKRLAEYFFYKGIDFNVKGETLIKIKDTHSQFRCLMFTPPSQGGAPKGTVFNRSPDYTSMYGWSYFVPPSKLVALRAAEPAPVCNTNPAGI